MPVTSSVSAQPTSESQSEVEAYLASGGGGDDLAYAADYDIPIEVAAARLKKQDSLGQLLPVFEEAAGERYVDARIVHGDNFGIEVTLTEGSPVAAVQDIVNDEKENISVSYRGSTSNGEMRSLLSARQAEWAEELAGYAGASYNANLGVVTVYVTAGAKGMNDRELSSSLESKLPEELSVKVVPMSGDGAQLSKRAGLSIYKSGEGKWCTEGFTIERDNSGTLGVTTSAHCEPYGLSYRHFGGSTDYALDYHGEAFDSKADVQWATIEATPKAEYYGVSTESPIAVTSVKPRGTSMLGDYVCHRGMTSGYSCGEIDDIYFQLIANGACGGSTCAERWIHMTGDSLVCQGGDSGGPVFLNGKAYGFLTACGHPAAGEYFGIFMSQVYLSGIDSHILLN